MTKILIIPCLLLLISSISSCNKSMTNAKINRDCTGTYLELNNKDYLVCNPSMAESYSNCSEIEVSFEFKSECNPNPNEAVCFMYHKSYGFVEITEIK